MVTTKANVLKVRKLPEGSLSRLKKAFDRAENGIADLKELPCEECGTPVSIYRKPRGDWPLRCGDCRHRARLKSKRDTWHRYKESYRLVRGKSSQPRRKPETQPTGKLAPVRLPTRQISGTASTRPNGPAIVWTPESGHKSDH